ncbi:MAG: metallopeptidase family protein [Dehalococcoidia bacterium]|nr:metallopeptidase family protein [Dehalococcoidia bacterium]
MTGDGAGRRRYVATNAPAIATLRQKRRHRFERMVARAINELPDTFRQAIANLEIVIVNRPSVADRAEMGLHRGEALLGLYRGTPLTRRDQGYNLTLPDTITLFQRSIEARCRDEAELVEQVRATLLHELAHHFGIDDERLDQLGVD